MRGKYKGQGFTYNQVYTWVGYLATAAKAKGQKEEHVNLLVNIAKNGLGFYAPFAEDIDNE